MVQNVALTASLGETKDTVTLNLDNENIMKIPSIIISLGLGTMSVFAADPYAATVNSPDGTLNVRQTPKVNGKLVSTLKNGDSVTVIESRAEWTTIKLADDSVGYVKAKYIKTGNGAATTTTNASLKDWPHDSDGKMAALANAINDTLADINRSNETIKALGSEGGGATDSLILERNRFWSQVGALAGQLEQQFQGSGGAKTIDSDAISNHYANRKGMNKSQREEKGITDPVLLWEY